MIRVRNNKLFSNEFASISPFRFVLVVFILFYCADMKSSVNNCLVDSIHHAGIRTRSVYKFNADFKDSALVYYEEIDSVNKILKSEGHIFFDFPLMSSENFELAQFNASDGDTIYDRYNLEHTCPIGSMECSSFIMRFDSMRRPSIIKHYGCHLVDKTTVFDKIYLDEAVFEYSDNGKKITMKVINEKGKMTECITRTYDKEGRIICTKWEVPQDGYYYKVFYGIYYK